MSIGFTTFCAEACPVMVEATNTGKVDGNEKWQLKFVINPCPAEPGYTLPLQTV